MYKTLLITVLLCLLSLGIPARSAPEGEDLQGTIDYLVEFVRTSDVVFIRNNDEHTPEEAASHMLKKYRYAKRKVKTPEDFIKCCATKSTVSGKPYTVRLADGRTIESSQWLLAALEEYRAGGTAGGSAEGIGYAMKEFRRKYGTCENQYEDCASVIIRYPEFSGEGQTPGLAEISREVRMRLLDPVYEDPAPETYDDLAESFISAYREMQEGFPDYRTGWTLEREAAVMYAGDSLVCIAFSEMSFTGGAHPNSRKAFVNFRAADGSAVGLSDLLVEGYEKELARAGERVFREARGLGGDESLEAAGFWFEGGVFQLNDNFGVTGEGLVFRFDHYDVAPYSMGSTEFTIPYKEIAFLISDEGPLEGVVK
jgi:hypothetical protein